MKTRPWKFVDFPSNATCLHWLATTITNCPRAEQILLNRLAKNITYCVVTIYITLHYFTLLYTFECLWDFFPVYISSHGSIICHLVRPSGLPEGLTRWQQWLRDTMLHNNEKKSERVKENLRLPVRGCWGNSHNSVLQGDANFHNNWFGRNYYTISEAGVNKLHIVFWSSYYSLLSCSISNQHSC